MARLNSILSVKYGEKLSMVDWIGTETIVLTHDTAVYVGLSLCGGHFEKLFFHKVCSVATISQEVTIRGFVTDF